MWLFMKPSIREDSETGIQTLRGFKLYEWQRKLLNYFGGDHPEHRVYFRS